MSCARKSSGASFDAASGGLSLLRYISKEAADYLGVFDAASGGLSLLRVWQTRNKLLLCTTEGGDASLSSYLHSKKWASKFCVRLTSIEHLIEYPR